ncbi:tRNA pseudouridine(55) synthase TruB [Marinobacter halodurans]|uniref:tRNA pseudouridine synthase B n=1 Tax=Marinobacter halodurans TaxID=2528979 RepID=A0ABY1ZGX8_9GAMM|nr:tRNA pseudouridine(55) synthase TruB [Marinobacter halodurans]TBW48412.1 tRNA pseudouridine(55) synthase TruB [Marinobacter halodurans]
MSRRRRGRDVSGILVIDKPQGVTSNAVLQQVKRLYGAAKAGHTGSLDPLATGVLPLCFGEATKFSQLMLDSDKSYVARGRLGIITDSGDSDGNVMAEKPLPEGLDMAAIEALLPRFRGDIEQVPSMYSALKYKGRPLYEYAREGIEIERPARPVTIHELTLLAFDGENFDIAVTCSKGTYIRSLVEDIGEVLGCGAHVTQLRRTRAAGFGLEQAYDVSDLDARREAGESLDPLLVPVDAALTEFPKILLQDAQIVSILNGQPVKMTGHPPGWVRLYGGDRFLGLGEQLPDDRVTPRRLVKQA